MKLKNYKFPKVSDVDYVFPTLDTTPELVKEANSRKLTKGRKKFNQLFFDGGNVKLKKGVKGTWKEDAFLYARVLMASRVPKHEDKESVCAMIFEECLVL